MPVIMAVFLFISHGKYTLSKNETVSVTTAAKSGTVYHIQTPAQKPTVRSTNWFSKKDLAQATFCFR